MLTGRTPSRGFTIIEMLVAIAIVAILLGLGVPSITGYIEAAKLNAAAQSYLSGIQVARTAAIRQNLRAEFILTDTPIQTLNAAVDNVVALPTGKNWVVRVVDPNLPPPGFVLIESKSATESSNTAAQSVEIAGVSVPPFTGTLAFNGFGGTADNVGYAFNLRNTRGGACAPAGPMRCPTILVPAGGLARICDPLVTVATDTRSC